jgi:hypothetical protein
MSMGLNYTCPNYTKEMGRQHRGAVFQGEGNLVEEKRQAGAQAIRALGWGKPILLGRHPSFTSIVTFVGPGKGTPTECQSRSARDGCQCGSSGNAVSVRTKTTCRRRAQSPCGLPDSDRLIRVLSE